METRCTSHKAERKEMKCQQGKGETVKEKKVDNIFKCCKRKVDEETNNQMTHFFFHR